MIVFDKAEQAERVEQEKFQLKQEIENMETSLKQVTNDGEKKTNQQTIDRMQERLESLEDMPKKDLLPSLHNPH